MFSATATLSAKSLRTLSMIYAVDELQNPLPRTTMLFEGDRNSTAEKNGELRASAIDRHCMKGVYTFL